MWTMGQKVRLNDGTVAIYKRPDAGLRRVAVLVGNETAYDLLVSANRISETLPKDQAGEDRFRDIFKHSVYWRKDGKETNIFR